ncbi:hypothetical protein F5146DRAFT_183150 [Armillaria mellea]|nr:hypothetical protein F5146DRAFT_183150 [Armillaria mellea]
MYSYLTLIILRCTTLPSARTSKNSSGPSFQCYRWASNSPLRASGQTNLEHDFTSVRVSLLCSVDHPAQSSKARTCTFFFRGRKHHRLDETNNWSDKRPVARASEEAHKA